jgi:translocation and assembly module TamB
MWRWLARSVGVLVLAVMCALTLAVHPPISDALLSRITSSVRTKGLTLHLSGELTANRIALRDAKGTYATLDKVTLHWSPLALMHRAVRVSLLTIEQAVVDRLPVSSSSGSSTGNSGLPVNLDVAKLTIGRLTLEPAVAGAQAVLAVTASAKLEGPEHQQASLEATAIGSPGTYKLNGALAGSDVAASLFINEAAGGFVAGAAGVPGMGPIKLDATGHGPRDAVAVKLALQAGPLAASAGGTVNLTGETADLTLAANAPAMRPRPDLSWQAVAMTAHVRGAFSSPEVTGQARIDGLEATQVRARQIALDAHGNKGAVALTGRIEGLIVPGKQPDMFAAAPVLLTADVNLRAGDRPVTFTLRHPLLEVSGTAQTAGTEQVHAQLRIPALAPFAAAEGQDLQGALTAKLNAERQGSATTAELDARLGITGGKSPVPAVIGPDAHLVLAGSQQGQQITLTRLSFDGQDLRFGAHGTVSPQAVAVDWSTAIARLSAIDPRLGGGLHAQGAFGGTASEVTLTADLGGVVTLQGESSGPLTAHLKAQGLPHAPSGTVTAHGELLSAPVDLALAATEQRNGAIQVNIQRAAWKSLSAHGRFRLLPGKTVPVGQVALAAQNLGDFSPLVGKNLSGSAQASLDATATQAVLTMALRDVGVPATASIREAELHTTITDLTTEPLVDGRLTVSGISAGTITGSAEMIARGPENALGVQVAARSPKLGGAPASLTTAGTVDVPGKSLALMALNAVWKGQTLRLLQPVRVAFSTGIAIDHLRLALDRAMIAVSGQMGSTLSLTASASDVPLSLAALVSPSLKASGTLSANARLTGTASAPSGVIRASASGVRLDTAQGKELPPASLTVTAELQVKTARVDARVAVGTSYVTLTGSAPFSMTAPMDLHARGFVDLAMANQALKSQGEGVAGTVTLVADITGTAAAPGGTIRANAAGLRLLSQTGQALPPASARMVATLAGSDVRLDTRVTAGASYLTVAGTAPLKTGGLLDLRADGDINLAVANPLLGATGQHVEGVVAIASRIGGTLKAPAVSGTARLTSGDFRDYAQGVHLSNIAAVIAESGQTIRIESLTAVAGNGTFSGNGTIGIMAPGMPIDLRIMARNATPLSGELVTATLNADLSITGQAEGRVLLGGRIFIQQAVVQVPNKLPASVATIPYRIAGAPPKPPAKPAFSPVLAMDLTIDAPQQVFIRGRGLNAELGGAITIRGTTKAMQPRGVLKLRRGTFNLVGNTLTFNSGDIDFNGGSLANPAILLVATSTVNGTVATLTVSGTARNPKITLSSQPELPQDQILALLLFHTSSDRLSPFQLASIAGGLAEISGTSSGITNPLQGVQNALGLDQLGVGSGPNGNPSLQAGRYVGRRLYVGAQQSTGGQGAQGVVTYDLTHGLKLNATVGTGQTTSAIGATGETNGASVGITYSFEY